MAEGIGFTKDFSTVLRPSVYGTVLGWWAAHLESFANGDAVGTFTDHSGLTHNLTQGTGANKPLFKTGVANGKPALLFDGTNDVLATSAFATEAQPVTIFVVAKRNTSGSDMVLLDGISGSHTLAITHLGATGKLQASGSAAISSFADFGTDWFVAQVTFNGASSSIWINDLPAASGTVGTGDLTGFTLGASYVPNTFWNGYVAEAIAFKTSTLSTESAYAIRRALMAEYKISPFDPNSISDLRSKFIGDSIRLRDGELGSIWEDQIGGYDVLQATGANQPTAKRDILNHRAVWRFATNDYFQSAAFTAIPQPATIFVVNKHNATIKTDEKYFDGIASGNRWSFGHEATTGKGSLFAGSGILSAADLGTSFNVLTAIINGASSFIYKNGTQVATGAAGSHTLTGYSIGARYDGTLNLNGDIYAILVYTAALSSTNRQYIEAWLKGLAAL